MYVCAGVWAHTSSKLTIMTYVPSPPRSPPPVCVCVGGAWVGVRVRVCVCMYVCVAWCVCVGRHCNSLQCMYVYVRMYV